MIIDKLLCKKVNLIHEKLSQQYYLATICFRYPISVALDLTIEELLFILIFRFNGQSGNSNADCNSKNGLN